MIIDLLCENGHRTQVATQYDDLPEQIVAIISPCPFRNGVQMCLARRVWRRSGGAKARPIYLTKTRDEYVAEDTIPNRPRDLYLTTEEHDATDTDTDDEPA